MDKISSSTILKKLSSLGCNFVVGGSDLNSDPEQTIIDSLAYFSIDKKVFTMLIAVLKFRIHHVINIKRLHLLSKDLDEDSKALLRVVALKVARHTSESKYIELESKLSKYKLNLSKVPEKYREAFYLQRRGVDKDFKKVGVLVADFFEDQPERKLKTLRMIYSQNNWIKYRALIGADYRADVFYLMKFRNAQSQAEVSNILKCNKSSVSRIFASFGNIEDLIEVTS